MPPHRPDPRQADLFFAYLVDLPLRDQADTMSLPVFSLGKLQRDLAPKLHLATRAPRLRDQAAR